ncbi:MAG: AEC family transporter [Clostridia bacterium]|nr:AEC family transporter [Clostridia bacterium]
MQGFETILNKIIYLAIMLAIGFVCEKTHYVERLGPRISQIVKNITLPLLILTTVSSQTSAGNTGADIVVVIVMCICVVAAGFLLGSLTAKIFEMGPKKRNVHVCMSAFGNVIFLGYPLCQALYGDEGLFFAVFYALANDCFVWTLGVRMFSGEKGLSGLKKLVNPCTAAFAAALLMRAFSLRFPLVFAESFGAIGSATTPLSMLFIGSTLAIVRPSEALKNVPIYILTAVKMLIIPILLLLLLPHGLISAAARGVLVLEAAMPGQVVLAILASEYKLDSAYAAQVIFITTLFSLFTLPLVYSLIQII